MQNNTVKKLFVCEFITCGGFHGQDLPSRLAHEGQLMRDALLSDLQALPDWHVITTHDVRVGRSNYVADSQVIDGHDDVWNAWQHIMQTVDYVWLIAPESDNILYRLTEMAQHHQCKVIGCSSDAIAICSDKFQTAQALAQANIDSIETFYYADWQASDAQQRWLVKPVDGVGCEDNRVFDDAQSMHRWFQQHPDKQASHIIQPYLQGIDISVSVLGLDHQAHLLSCNLQQLTLDQGQLHYQGGLINGALAYQDVLTDIVAQVHQAITSLRGYYGIDILLQRTDSDKIASIKIIEINPRLTTSYIALGDAIGCNPAQLILDGVTQANFIMSPLTHKTINIEL